MEENNLETDAHDLWFVRFTFKDGSIKEYITTEDEYDVNIAPIGDESAISLKKVEIEVFDG